VVDIALVWGGRRQLIAKTKSGLRQAGMLTYIPSQDQIVSPLPCRPLVL
jgi:hypothetical protein